MKEIDSDTNSNIIPTDNLKTNDSDTNINEENVAPAGVRERLMYLLKYKRMSRTEFARRLGLSINYVGAIRKSLPSVRVRQIMELFPDLNRDWLLYGEGAMLNPSGDEQPRRRRVYEIPMLPVQAEAGTLSSMSQGVMPCDCETVISPVDADLAIQVRGDSMEPNFSNGDTLFIKRINEKNFIPWGNPMVIDTENGVLVKAVYPVEGDSEMIEARSYNPTYPPLRVPTATIYGLYQVTGRISIFTTL